MPEGHTIHRLAAEHLERFGGEPVRATSPQGRFADGAALLDGQTLAAAEAHGKHLFLSFTPAGAVPRHGADRLHIHLGLFGRLDFTSAPAPPAGDTVRLRLANDTHCADLRGPATCQVINEAEKDALHARLGPDPLRPEDDGARAWHRVSRSRSSIATLLLDQRVIAGVGNVYRAEVLFRHGVDPWCPGRELSRSQWDALWRDLVELMRQGVRNNRIDTVRAAHAPEAMGRSPRVDDHGGEVYVYRRAGLPCYVCGSEVRTADLATRNLFWCAGCQPAVTSPAGADAATPRAPEGGHTVAAGRPPP